MADIKPPAKQDTAKQDAPVRPGAPENVGYAEPKKVADDSASYDPRFRGSELKMSDLDAGNSHLAAQNQVPQEGALVTDPPQPEPPHDTRHDVQDHSDDKSRTVEYPDKNRLGHGSAL